MDNTEEDVNIGVITGIDGEDIENIDGSDRKFWAESLCEELEDIEGITQAFIDSTDPNFSTVTIAAEISHTESYSGYKLNPNLRSVGQKIRNKIDTNKYASANIVENNIESPTKDADDVYDTCFYFITVHYP